MMSEGGNRSGTNDWNLDGLELKKEFKTSGQLQLKRAGSIISSSWQVGFLHDHILRTTLIVLLRPGDGQLQCVDSTDQKFDVPEWPVEQSPAMFIEHRYLEEGFGLGEVDSRNYMNSFLYLLSRDEGEVSRYSLSLNGLSGDEIWPLGEYRLTSKTQIAVASPHDETDSTAYIGPCEGGAFIRLDLAGESIEEFPIRLPGAEDKLGDEVYLCPDDANRSLLISDTENHRIIEVDCQTSQAEIICGTGERGAAPEGEPAASARIDSPRGIAVYRPFDLIDEGFLTEKSKELVQSDVQKIRPRTVIFADSGNFKVRKIVDPGKDLADSLSVSERPSLYTLLGTGYATDALTVLANDYWEDLRTYPITKPFALAVSNIGELLVACASTPYLILLRPATTIISERGYFAGFNERLQHS